MTLRLCTLNELTSTRFLCVLKGHRRPPLALYNQNFQDNSVPTQLHGGEWLAICPTYNGETYRPTAEADERDAAVQAPDGLLDGLKDVPELLVHINGGLETQRVLPGIEAVRMHTSKHKTATPHPLSGQVECGFQ